MKKLYLVSTPTLQSYVVANGTDEAKACFEDWLRANDYGYLYEREVSSIEIIAKEGINPKDGIMNKFDKLILVGN